MDLGKWENILFGVKEARIMKTYRKRQELPSDFFPSEEPNAATSRDMLGTSHPDTESSYNVTSTAIHMMNIDTCTHMKMEQNFERTEARTRTGLRETKSRGN